MSCASCCAHDIACHAVVTVNTTAQQHHASDQNGERTPSSQGLAQTNPPTPDVDIPTKSATSHHAPQEHKQNQESVQKRGPLHGIWVLSPRMTLLVAHEVRAGGFGRVRRLFRAVGSGSSPCMTVTATGVAPSTLLTAVARVAGKAVSVEALCRAIDYTMKRVTVDPFFTTVPASGSV